MNLQISLLFAAVAVARLLGSAQTFVQNAYIPNGGSNTVSILNTAKNTVTATIRVGSFPFGVAVDSKIYLYVTNQRSNTLSVINTVTNMVTATNPGRLCPEGVAVTPTAARSMSPTRAPAPCR